MFEIEFYTTENGKTPVADFLDTLPQKLRAKVTRDISMLSIAGNTLSFPLSSPMGGGLFELKRKPKKHHRVSLNVPAHIKPTMKGGIPMKFNDYLAKQLSDPDFKEAWDALEPEYQILEQILTLREEQHLTQEQLAALSGINRSDVSRLEHANANPSIKTLNRIAGAFGKRLQITFV